MLEKTMSPAVFALWLLVWFNGGLALPTEPVMVRPKAVAAMRIS